MGYVFIRTGVFRNAAAVMAGIPVAKEIAELVRRSHGVEARVLAPAWSGCPGRVSWVMPSDTLGRFYELLAKVSADPKYLDAVRRLGDQVDGTLTRDQVWREVSTASSGRPATAARYTAVRSIAFKNLGALSAGLPVLAEICGHVLKTQNAETRLYVPAGSGHVSRALMVRSTDDLDQAQATMDKAMSDDVTRSLLQRLLEFVDGSKTEDSLWRSVE